MKRIFERQTKILYLFGFLIDITVLILADLISFRIHLGKDFYFSVNFGAYLNVFFYVILFKLLCLYIFQLYNIPRVRTNFITFINIVKATTSSSLVMAIIAYFFRAEVIPRMVILWSWFFTALFLFSWRMLAKGVLKFFLGDDFFKLPILIVGSDEPAEEMAIWLLNNGIINYKLIGFVSDKPSESRKDLLGFPILDTIENIDKIPKRYHIEQVFVMTPHVQFKHSSKIFSAFRRRREVTFCARPELCEDVISYYPFSEGRIQFIPSVPFQKVAVWYPPVKRIIDILIASVLLVILAPLMITVAIAIKMSSHGPVFYLTKRVGYMGRHFVMYKFRSMYQLSSERMVERWAKKYDERITPIGRLIRRFRIDELPQLFNVLKGDMSIIGPRPEGKYYVMRLAKKIPLYIERLNAKPGISGWAQVNYGYAGTIEESRKKLLFDIYYIQNQSISLDLLIGLKTFKTVITGAGL